MGVGNPFQGRVIRTALSIMTQQVRKYWFRFERRPKPTAINLGCGVTAYDYDDAIGLLRDRIFGANGPPPIVEAIEDVDLSSLEQKHVLPNIGDTATRGIWFPQGYDKLIKK
jgi:hypothetical protein